MPPTVEDLQAIWLFTYSRASLLDAAKFLAELDTVAPESRQYRALIDATIAAYARPFTVCLLPPERKRVVPLEYSASLGFEPRQRDPESLVLPLHYEAKPAKANAKLAKSEIQSLLRTTPN